MATVNYQVIQFKKSHIFYSKLINIQKQLRKRTIVRIMANVVPGVMARVDSAGATRGRHVI
jgi:hypothetical protein